MKLIIDYRTCLRNRSCRGRLARGGKGSRRMEHIP